MVLKIAYWATTIIAVAMLAAGCHLSGRQRAVGHRHKARWRSRASQVGSLPCQVGRRPMVPLPHGTRVLKSAPTRERPSRAHGAHRHSSARRRSFNAVGAVGTHLSSCGGSPQCRRPAARRWRSGQWQPPEERNSAPSCRQGGHGEISSSRSTSPSAERLARTSGESPPS